MGKLKIGLYLSLMVNMISQGMYINPFDDELKSLKDGQNRYNSEQIVKALLKNPKSDVNAPNAGLFNLAPLGFACLFDSYAYYTQELLKRGARVDTLCTLGIYRDRNLFHVCAFNNRTTVNAELLIKYAPAQLVNVTELLNTGDAISGTPLLEAFQKRRVALIELYMLHGAQAHYLTYMGAGLDHFFHNDPIVYGGLESEQVEILLDRVCPSLPEESLVSTLSTIELGTQIENKQWYYRLILAALFTKRTQPLRESPSPSYINLLHGDVLALLARFYSNCHYKFPISLRGSP